MTALWSMNVSLQVWMCFLSFSAWGSCSCGQKRRDLALHWNPMLSNGLQNSLALKDWHVLSVHYACYRQLSASDFESYELCKSHLCNNLWRFWPTSNNIQSSTWRQKVSSHVFKVTACIFYWKIACLTVDWIYKWSCRTINSTCAGNHISSGYAKCGTSRIWTPWTPSKSTLEILVSWGSSSALARDILPIFR